MSKLTNLVVSAVIAVPLLAIVNGVAANSKTQVKNDLNLCELKTGERGFVRGQVISVDKGDWGNKLVTIGEGIQGCRLTIKTNPNQNFLLQQVGNRVKVLIKVNTEYSASTIGDSTKEDIGVIGADGNIVPVESIEQQMGTGVLESLKKFDKAILNVADENTSYQFTRDILNGIEAKKTYRWYYQTSMSGLKIVNRVEPVN
jgi:hypothetical protein